MAAVGQNLPHQHPAECRAVISISDAGGLCLCFTQKSLLPPKLFYVPRSLWCLRIWYFFLFFREEISCLKCIWHLFWSHLSLWGKWKKKICLHCLFNSSLLLTFIHGALRWLQIFGAAHAPFISTIKIDQTSYSIQSSTFSCQICQLDEKWISPLYTGE